MNAVLRRPSCCGVPRKARASPAGTLSFIGSNTKLNRHRGRRAPPRFTPNLKSPVKKYLAPRRALALDRGGLVLVQLL